MSQDIRPIDANRLISSIENDKKIYGKRYWSWDAVVALVKTQPTISHANFAHWEDNCVVGEIAVGTCSACKLRWVIGRFCGNCGANMMCDETD